VDLRVGDERGGSLYTPGLMGRLAL
jgi:hypothetical protein